MPQQHNTLANLKFIITIPTVKKSNKMQRCYQNVLLFFILNEAQRVSGDTPPIIRSLKLHKQPLVLQRTLHDNVTQLHV
jgi:hypothetical protein